MPTLLFFLKLFLGALNIEIVDSYLISIVLNNAIVKVTEYQVNLLVALLHHVTVWLFSSPMKQMQRSTLINAS